MTRMKGLRTPPGLGSHAHSSSQFDGVVKCTVVALPVASNSISVLAFGKEPTVGVPGPTVGLGTPCNPVGKTLMCSDDPGTLPARLIRVPINTGLLPIPPCALDLALSPHGRQLWSEIIHRMKRESILFRTTPLVGRLESLPPPLYLHVRFDRLRF